MSIQPPPTPTQHGDRLRRLLQLEADFQRQHRKQQALLRHIAASAMSLHVWWREGAAAAAAAFTPTPPDTASSRSDPRSSVHSRREDCRCVTASPERSGEAAGVFDLRTNPGARFYSLGELLLLLDGTAPPQTAWTSTQEGEHAVERRAAPLVSGADTQEFPSCVPPWRVAVTALQFREVFVSAPAVLVRQRLLDPDSIALPPLHALLLGSVTTATFPLLVAQMHGLVLECGAALEEAVMLAGEKEVSPPAAAVTASASRLLVSVCTPAKSGSRCAGAELRSPDATPPVPPQRSGDLHRGEPPHAQARELHVDQRSSGEAPSQRTAECETARSLPWSSLCASLYRLLSFWRVATTAATQGSPEPQWEVCWSAFLACQWHRGPTQQQLLVALCGIRDALQVICRRLRAASPTLVAPHAALLCSDAPKGMANALPTETLTEAVVADWKAVPLEKVEELYGLAAVVCAQLNKCLNRQSGTFPRD